MNKKLNVTILAIIFGLIGLTLSYFYNLNKLNKIDTEINLEFYYVGENLYPKIIENDKYNKLLLDRFMPDLRRLIDVEILRMFQKYNEIYKFHYTRKNSKTHSFSIIGLDHKENKETLIKIKNLIMKEVTEIIRKDLIENNNILKSKLEECKTIDRKNLIKNIIITENNIANLFKDWIHDNHNSKEIKKYSNEVFEEIRKFNNKYIDPLVSCEEYKKQANNINLIMSEFDKLTSYKLSFKKQYVVKELSFILLRGFINGILVFIFLRLSIMYFRK